MSKANRKRYTSSFKSKVALEAIKGELTLSEISAKYGVGQTQVSNWKKLVLDNIRGIFDSGTNKCSSSANQEQHIKELHAKIGELTLERDFLERASRL